MGDPVRSRIAIEMQRHTDFGLHVDGGGGLPLPAQTWASAAAAQLHPCRRLGRLWRDFATCVRWVLGWPGPTDAQWRRHVLG